MKRKIVNIDESKCNGCGQCIPKCAEGALQIINGKAKLVKDTYCDGLGACLGQCPQGAITVSERDADAFDEKEVHEYLKSKGITKPTTVPASIES
ncbi:MAG TPA: 4Fe-4S binding protein, partial [Candidatus Acidoferrales bacterium]|nr:4Fe-4S binding protein [Candidatus Acidoferrales bacterium]